MRAGTPFNARTTALALAVVSVLAVLGVAAVAVGVATRDEPARPDAARTDPYAGWQAAEGDGASYRVPADWTLHPAGERVSYRDSSGRAQARGAALSTYDGGGCAGNRPAAWAVLAEPVRARDVEAVAVAAARQWARGFAAGERGTWSVSEPVTASTTLHGGAAAVVAEVSVELRGEGTPCGAERGELTVVAARAGPVVRAVVLARVTGALADRERDQILRSLT